MPAFDVIVIGSGFGGAVAACRLAEKDMKVLVLERGRRWDTYPYGPRKPEDAWLWNQRSPERANGCWISGVSRTCVWRNVPVLEAVHWSMPTSVSTQDPSCFRMAGRWKFRMTNWHHTTRRLAKCYVQFLCQRNKYQPGFG